MRAEKVLQRIRWLRDQLFTKDKLARSLSETGKVTRDQLPQLARTALDEGPILYNPVELNYEDMLALLERAW